MHYFSHFLCVNKFVIIPFLPFLSRLFFNTSDIEKLFSLSELSDLCVVCFFIHIFIIPSIDTRAYLVHGFGNY